MTNRETLRSLADACEVLSGPCRETDALIHLACRPFPERAYAQKSGLRPKGSPELSRVDFLKQGYALPYTASIDAAMSLAPEGCDWSVTCEQRRGIAYTNRGAHFSADTLAATPALALTAASLRAIGEGL